MRRLPFIASLLTALFLVGAGCSQKSGNDAEKAAQCIGVYPDTLRVATLYSPLSYFIYRDEAMGYDYELLKKFSEDKGVPFELIVAPSLSRAVEMLDSGMVDLIAYEVPITGEYAERVVPAGHENVTYQVLVQPKTDSILTDVTQLVDCDIYVEKDSKYLYRLQNLDAELGGGIRVHPVNRDTLITEDLIAMVSDGTIPMTVVDSDIASINKSYYKDLDITLQISYPQRSAWGVSPTKAWLADSITEWSKMEKPLKARNELLKRYFERSKISGEGRNGFAMNLTKGTISPYDALFKQYAQSIGWDWRWLAAQGYAESRFDPSVRSWAGARGLMQIMPSTAQAYGVSGDDILDNDINVRTAVKIISALENIFEKKVPDKEQRRLFVLAAYNAGAAHVLDAIALAKKYGKDPTVWDNNVAEAILMKSNPDYYNDPVVKYGYCRGKQTFAYVNEVRDYYHKAKQQIPE